MIKENNKKFFKDEVGFILFVFVYIAIFLQMIGVYTTSDESIESNLFYHKLFFTIICILSITSHIKASITNPGMIDHDNNSCVCTFYLQVHHLPMERAKRIMAQGYAKMLFENFNEEDERDDEDNSDSDDEMYKPYSSISEETRTHICKKFDVEFKRAVIGEFDVDLIHEFFQGFVNHANITMHIDNLKGDNSHHQAETIYKAFGRALKMAVCIDPKISGITPSTKGSL